MPDAGQHIAKEIFQALVLVGPEGQLARRPAPQADLCGDRRGASRRAVDNVLEAFVGSRLLVLDGDTVQIAHDVLLRAWPRLRGWLEGDQASWILYAQLQEDAAQWAEHGRDPAFLYRGTQLAAVRQAAARWAADPARYPALARNQSGFLEASGRNAARSVRLRRGAVLTLALLLVISLAGVAVAVRADRTANQQRSVAISSQLAAQSEALDATNPVAAASLAAAAWKIAPTAEAQTSLLDVLAQPHRASITVASGNITAMAFSPDGKRFATATDKGAAQVWDTATHREIGKTLTIKQGYSVGIFSIFFSRNDTAMTVYGAGGGPNRFYNISTRRAIGPPFQIADNPFDEATFSPDGKIIATGGNTAFVGIVDVATRRQVGALIPNSQALAFSPDGKRLAVGTSGGSASGGAIQVLDVATRSVVASFPGGSSQYSPAAAFSPGGKALAITGAGSVSFWDIARHRTIGAPIAASADGLSWSPNGKILATVSPVGSRSTAVTINLWDAASHQELGGALTVDTNPGGLTFSPDSRMLATADGSTVSFWDVAVSRQIGALVTGAGPVSFSPDGQFLATFMNHGAGLWNIAARREIGEPIMASSTPFGGAAAMAFSPDGKILAVGARYKLGTQLWDIASRRMIGTPVVRGDGQVTALAFSPDGKYLVIGSGSSWMLDVRKHRVIGRPMTNAGVTALAFSPDGSILAVAEVEYPRVRLLSMATHRQIGVPFAVGRTLINAMAFSPDGSIVATASDSGVALWDVKTHHQLGTPLNVGVGPVQALAFSPDGMILAAASDDGAIRLWDVASHEQVGSPLVVNNNPILGIAFSPDGTVLAAGNAVATRLWGVAFTKDILNRVCSIAGGSMTKQEWNSYIKSEPFQQTCP